MSNNLSGTQKDLIRMVIRAARDGRYCHGNGADWAIVDPTNKSMVLAINHVTGKIAHLSQSESEKYLRNTRPHRDEATARDLENFIAKG